MTLNRVVLTLLLFIPICVVAQPTITSDVVARIGTEITTEVAEEAPEAGPSGANAEWDFSEVTKEDSSVTVSFVYVTSDTTQHFASYPESNVCLYGNGIESYTYFNRSNAVFENLGNALGSFRQVYTDPLTIMTFPFTFGSTVEDDYTSISQIAGIEIHGWGSVSVEADAYGSLRLPGADFNNVLRIRTMDERVDSTDLGLGIFEKVHTNTLSYTWMDPVSGEAVATHATSEGFTVAIVPPLPPDTSFFGPQTTFSYDPSVTSSVRHLNKIAATLSPNPTHERVRLTFELNAPERLNLRVMTVDGLLLIQETIEGLTGINEHLLGMEGIPSGTYVLHLRGKTSYLTVPLVRQ